MDFDLSDELIAVRDLAREFAEKEIAPTAAKDDKEKTFRGDLVRKMGELGFYGTMIPETYGGNGLGISRHGADHRRESPRVHSAMRVAINMQIGPALTLLQFGTEEQKQKFIPGLVSGETIGCFAITESDAGSDVAAMRTTATKNGDRYFLNGGKTLDLQRAGDQRRAGLRVYRPGAETSRHERVLRGLESTRA